jgi:hypothetical protein
MQYNAPMPVGGASMNKSQNKNIIFVSVAALVVIVGSIYTFNMVQENQRQVAAATQASDRAAESAAAQATADAAREADISEIEEVINAYTRAIASFNFDRAAQLGVTGFEGTQVILDGLPRIRIGVADIDFGALLRAGAAAVNMAQRSLDGGFSYEFSYSRGDIQLRGTRATVPVTEIAIVENPTDRGDKILLDQSQSRTVHMVKEDGRWLIEIIS